MIVVHFDVLARPHIEFGQRVPIVEGIRLWSDLYETHRGRLGLVVDDVPKPAILEHWLKINGVIPVVTEVLDTFDPPMKAEKIQRLMSAVGSTDWYVDIDPDTVAHTLRLGIPSLLLTYPYIPRPEWGATPPLKSWDVLVAEVDRQSAVRADRELANQMWGDG